LYCTTTREFTRRDVNIIYILASIYAHILQIATPLEYSTSILIIY